MRGRATLILVALIICGLAIGAAARALIVRRVAQSAPPIALEPPFIELAHEPLEGTHAEAQVQLVNHSTEVARIVVWGSCNCMALQGRGGRSLASPIELAPGESFPIRAIVDTDYRVGRQKVLIYVRHADGPQGVPIAQSAIEFYIHGWLRAATNGIAFDNAQPEETREQMVELVDDFPDSGIGIERVETSDPERLHCATERADDAPCEFGGVPMKRRHRAIIRYRPPRDRAETMNKVVIHPKAPGHPPIEIAVHCRLRRGAYEFVPDRLLVTGRTTTTPIQRRVVCRSTNGTPLELRLVRAPAGVTARIEESDKGATRWIALEITGPLSENAEERVIRFEAGETHEPLAFPIVIVGVDG